MTKSFEVAIAIMLLLTFVFFTFEIYSSEYTPTEIPSEIKNLILIKAKEPDFRNLVENKDSENIYKLLYKDIDQKYIIKICDDSGCVFSDTDTLKYKRNLEYYFAEIDKTLVVSFLK